MKYSSHVFQSFLECRARYWIPQHNSPIFASCVHGLYSYKHKKTNKFWSLHDIKRFDSGEKLTAVTSEVWCPCRRCFGLKFLVLHMMTVWSAELVASHFVSGLNAQHKTPSSCPVSVCSWAPTNGFLDEDPPMFTGLPHPNAQAQPAPPTFVRLRLRHAQPTYMCVLP